MCCSQLLCYETNWTPGTGLLNCKLFESEESSLWSQGKASAVFQSPANLSYNKRKCTSNHALPVDILSHPDRPYFKFWRLRFSNYFTFDPNTPKRLGKDWVSKSKAEWDWKWSTISTWRTKTKQRFQVNCIVKLKLSLICSLMNHNWLQNIHMSFSFFQGDSKKRNYRKDKRKSTIDRSYFWYLNLHFAR